jgi:hypothetical protein
MQDDWDSLLSNDEPATFPLVPDESVEKPEAHIKPVKFTKTPLFLWGVVASGSVGFILSVYAVTSYVSGTRKAVAVAPPADPNAFVSPRQQEEDFFPKAPEGAPVAPVAVAPKNTTGKVSPRRTSARSPYQNRVVYLERPSTRMARLPVQQSYSAPRVSAPASRPQPAQVFKPAPLPEPIGALYAPDSGEGPQVEDTVPETPIAVTPVASQNTNPSVENALAIYDGTQPVAANTVERVEPTVPALSPPQMSPIKVAEVSDSMPDPLTSEEFEKKFPQKAAQENLIARLAIPAETTIKGQTMTMLSWNSQENFPVGEEIRIKVRKDFEQDGKVIIPKNSIAIAQSEKGTMGQYIVANVTRIETPSGQSYSIQPGMLTASNRDGFISADLKSPSGGSGVGKFFSKIGRSALNIGVASIAPEGDGFGDRIARNAIYSGLDSVNDSLDGDRQGNVRGQVPSLYVIKPKTSIQLVANGDIELQGDFNGN